MLLIVMALEHFCNYLKESIVINIDDDDGGVFNYELHKCNIKYYNNQ